jgi:hypothetical protein
MGSGESPENRCSLQGEPGETAETHDTAQVASNEGRVDAETTGTNPFTNADLERRVTEGERGSPPRYNLRPLPGRKL